MLRFALLLALAVLGACRSDPDAARPASEPAATRDPAATGQRACGSETCGPDQFCESRYQGHGSDAQGRSIGRYKCNPLPEACRSDSTCACVTKHVTSTRCVEKAGRVFLDDSPTPQ